MAKMREIYRQQLAATREQLARLMALQAELAQSLRYLETCDACDPARLAPACTSCELHADGEAPELVAGVQVKNPTEPV
jgi:hypothetical protein